jgi:hypothetical protein
MTITIKEARQVAEICSDADNGCPECVGDLMDRLIDAFPQFKWTWEEDNEYHIVVTPRYAAGD